MLLLTLSALIKYGKAILDANYQQTFIYTLRRRLSCKIIMADWQMLNTRSKTTHLHVLIHEAPNLATYYFFYIRLMTTVIMTVAYTAYALLVLVPYTLVIIAVGGLLFNFQRRFLLQRVACGKSMSIAITGYSNRSTISGRRSR